MVIEALGHSVDGTPLVVVRDGMQQPLPYPVSLHPNAGLSPSAGPADAGTSSSGLFPVSVPGQALPSCSSADLALAPSLTAQDKEAGSCRGRRRRVKKKGGFQPGNKCWKLSERWKTGTMTEMDYKRSVPVSSGHSMYKNVSLTRRMAVNNEPPQGLVRGTKVNTEKSQHSLTAQIASPKSLKKINKKGSPRKIEIPKMPSVKEEKNRKSEPRTGSKGPKCQTHEHVLTKVPWTDQKKQPRKICVVCRDEGRILLSSYFCSRCPDQPGFCQIRNCFSSHHYKMGLNYVPFSGKRSKSSA